MTKPLCFDCLSEDVTVKVIDQYGFEHWFCAEDWAAQQQFHEGLMSFLGLSPEGSPRSVELALARVGPEGPSQAATAKFRQRQEAKP